jgi:hypothetical protein
MQVKNWHIHNYLLVGTIVSTTFTGLRLRWRGAVVEVLLSLIIIKLMGKSDLIGCFLL